MSQSHLSDARDNITVQYWRPPEPGRNRFATLRNAMASANAQQFPLSASAGQSAFSQLHSPLARNSALTGAYVPRQTAWIVRTALKRIIGSKRVDGLRERHA